MAKNLIIQYPRFKSVSLVYNPKDPVYVCDFGWHATEKKHSFGPAVRPYYLIHFVVNGSGYIERAGEQTYVSKGQAFIICPEESTLYYASENEPWEYYWISFHGDFAKTLLSRVSEKLVLPYQKNAILTLKTALNEEYEHPVTLLNVLLSALSSLQDQGDENALQDVVGLAVSYIENYYFKNITVENLAAQCGYSRAYFSTLFCKRMGEAPYEYLTKVRLSHAKAFLSQTTYTVEEIAYSVGYSCVGRFSELFKKHEGVSPMQYRNAHR